MKAQRDGRDIDPAVGVLRGEGALQRVKHLGPEHPTPRPDRLHDSTSEADAYYGLPALKEPVWKAWIPAYFYVGGLAGAAAVLSAAAQLGGDPRLRGLVRRGRLLALGGAAVSGGLLIEDLGRPARFLAMLRIFRPSSPMSVGTWVLSAFAAAAFAAALPQALGAAGVRPFRARGSALERAAARGGIAAGVFGLPLCGYTAVLLANTAVPVWQGAHRTLPPLFVASAASSAHAALEPFADCEAEARVLHRFGVAGKLAALTAMRALEREVGRSARAAAPLQGGVAGALWKSAKALFTLSLALTLLPGRKKAPPARIGSWKTLASSALATAGSLCLRFAVVQAGHASARDPRASFEPQRARLGDHG
jgi:formate-dependent nitrite reductase membrane component NrfD